MEVVDVLRALGGVARTTQLRRQLGWRALVRARGGCEVRQHRGVWSLQDSGRAVVAAAELRGVRSHRSAAEHWRLALPPTDDERCDVTVPRGAKRAVVPADVHLRYRSYRPDQLAGTEGTVTTPLTTVVDCLRDGNLRTALSVGDSALAQRLVHRAELERAVRALRGPGSRRARERLALLDGRAANAFESCARAVLVEAGITGFEPQVTIRHRGRFIGRVDLADRARRIVIECDGYEHHGDRAAFVRDLVRCTSLVAAGWRPLRFTWEQVMFHPDWVLEQVRDTIGAGTTSQRPLRAGSAVA